MKRRPSIVLVACIGVGLLVLAGSAAVALRGGDEPATRPLPPAALPPLHRTIAFARGREGGPSDIYVARADGSDERRLTHGSGVKQDPDWSPDGDFLLYRSDPPIGSRATDGGLIVIRSDGTERVEVMKLAKGYAGPASWSPSGDLIVLSGRRPADEREGIYVVRPDGTGLKRLTPDGREAQYPAWSPDGKQIAFTYVEGSQFNIHVMNSDGTHIRKITRGGFDNWPVWSPDSLRIAFNRGETMWIVRPDGRGERPVVGSMPGGAPMNWAPSRWLIFNCAGKAGGIGICTQLPDSKKTFRLLKGADGGFGAWRPN